MPVPPKEKILLVDDETAILNTLSLLLEDSGWQVTTASGGMEALDALDQDIYDLMITDLRMPDLDGLSLFQKAKAKDSLLEVIFISAYADLKSAVQAVKNGAFDYIHKSFTPDELLLTVQKALEHRQLREENRKLKRALDSDGNFQGMIAKSQEMQEMAAMVERVAETKATVLISGESGVGKGMLARAIHSLSPRKLKPLVTINCGAIAETLVESELFGYEKGAFTGAVRTTSGQFEQAHQGTVFLDEIGELPLAS
jgi:DNA-binding NtrC family response regulator